MRTGDTQADNAKCLNKKTGRDERILRTWYSVWSQRSWVHLLNGSVNYQQDGARVNMQIKLDTHDARRIHQPPSLTRDLIADVTPPWQPTGFSNDTDVNRWQRIPLLNCPHI